MNTNIKKLVPSIITALIGIILVLLIPSQIDLSRVRNSSSVGMTAQTIPNFLAYAIILFSILDIVIKTIKKEVIVDEPKPAEVSYQAYLRVVFTFFGILIWILAGPYIGFVIGTTILLIVIMLLMGNRKWYLFTLIPLCTSFLLRFVFTEFVGRSLPSGIFFN